MSSDDNFAERFMRDYSAEEQKFLFAKMLQQQSAERSKNHPTIASPGNQTIKKEDHRPVTPPSQNMKRSLQSPYSPHRGGSRKVIPL